MALRVSIVIVAYNSGRFLQACVDALALQTFAAFEALIVDNASTDGAVATLVLPDDRFRICPMGHNLGFAAANNRAVQRSTAPYVVLLNPDTQVQPGWLGALVQAADANPGAASIGSVQRRLDEPSRLDGVGDVWHVAGLAWRAREGQLAPDAMEDAEIFGPCAAAALYRRDLFLAAGGFDERFFCYMEDVDLAFRFRRAGYGSMRAGEALVLHAGSGTTGRWSDFSLYHGHRNRIWTFLKNTPRSVFPLALAYHLAFNALYALIAIRRGFWRPIFRAYRDAWRGREPFLAERRAGPPVMPLAEFMRISAWTPWSPWKRAERPEGSRPSSASRLETSALRP
jgi:N-acetylglucosaminyl-diphospho-decaprenol L-rhamnosyltransferase